MAYCNLTELIGSNYLNIEMTVLLVQKELGDGVILLLFFTDLQVEDLECFEIAVDVCIALQ
jgi:hypothetical protein